MMDNGKCLIDCNTDMCLLFLQKSVTCKNGQFLMTKVDAEKTDVSAITLLPSLEIGCGLNGMLNQSVNLYTCTKDCSKPIVDTSIMSHDWTKTTDPVHSDNIT